ncbi:MAG: nucleoside hydrolase [Tannerella sp.]|jgi:inosine-uridine nucleoside N-ribohydrolase|nr:nucleoside hydrolase [Tannerella sp.]
MKHLIISILILAMASCNSSSNKPVSLIFDTDLGPDYDDVGALTLLHALADKGEVRLLATVSCNKYEFSCPSIDVINTYYGRPSLPIGKPQQGVTQADGHNPSWAEALPAKFRHKLRKTSDAPDAVAVYRKILAAEPDNSVVIVTVGFFTNLAALLDSKPDEYSKLNGKQLISKKVKHLVSMAGGFPSGREYNVHCDTKSSQKVMTEWPSQIYLSGFEIGQKILTGKRLIESNISDTPAKEAFTICLKQDNPEGRCSWDQTAALVGVRGYANYFNTVRGKMTVADDGSNTWQDDLNGRHEYFTWKMPIPELTQLIEDLMMHVPSIPISK